MDEDVKEQLLQRLRAERDIRTSGLRHSQAQDLCRERFGFSLRTGASTIKNGGKGVFLSGHCPESTILTLYPGSVYNVEKLTSLVPGAGFDDDLQPELPSFMFQNHYLLNMGPSATLDAPAGILIDGSMHSPSSQLLLELAQRESSRHGASVVDVSWISHNPSNLTQMNRITAPLEVARNTDETESEFTFPSSMALGSLINHSYHLEERSCRFQCFLLSDEEYLDLIPSINVSGLPPTPRVVVCVLATTCISTEEGQEMELFTDYGQDPLSLGIDLGYAGRQTFD
ncbi:hypothetical protein CYMTET_7541 [Cymbomonas tetramitiformis]|uniref:SET domain-containing protein n=1 Tax=Cymbomonas tetramitiformis TaxID=36881 RepID=A0AAE0LHE0_9CHLO|nr:hypothetical protein CYMTET_7541 [Cymbomonas tetramitiformis]